MLTRALPIGVTAMVAMALRAGERPLSEVAAVAERRIGSHRNRASASTVADLRILAGLALYHSWRIRPRWRGASTATPATSTPSRTP